MCEKFSGSLSRPLQNCQNVFFLGFFSKLNFKFAALFDEKGKIKNRFLISAWLTQKFPYDRLYLFLYF